MIWTHFNSATGEYSQYDDGLPSPPICCLCPCRGFKTLPKRQWNDVCPVCDWEDDGQDDHNDGKHNPWNHMITLRNARRNFVRFRASVKRRKPYVRPALPEETVGAKSYRMISSQYDPK